MMHFIWRPAECCYPEWRPSRPDQRCFVWSLHRRSGPQRQVSTHADCIYINPVTCVRRRRVVYMILSAAGLETLLKGIWWWGRWPGPLPGSLWSAPSSQHAALASSHWPALPDSCRPSPRTTSSLSSGLELQTFILITGTAKRCLFKAGLFTHDQTQSRRCNPESALR